jgi:hypothetical protein
MVAAMSAEIDVMAIRLIGDEVVRLLSLPDDRLDEAETRAGLKVIAELARWRDVVYAEELTALQRRGGTDPHRLA